MNSSILIYIAMLFGGLLLHLLFDPGREEGRSVREWIRNMSQRQRVRVILAWLGLGTGVAGSVQLADVIVVGLNLQDVVPRFGGVDIPAWILALPVSILLIILAVVVIAPLLNITRR